MILTEQVKTELPNDQEISNLKRTTRTLFPPNPRRITFGSLTEKDAESPINKGFQKIQRKKQGKEKGDFANVSPMFPRKGGETKTKKT